MNGAASGHGERISLTRAIHSIHNWLGLLLGAQVLLWMASGAVMTLFAIELVRGETHALERYPPELPAQAYASPGGIVAQAPWATEITLKYFMGQPVYVATGRRGSALFYANTARQISPLKEADARAVARQDFIGRGEIASVRLLGEAPRECGCEAPVWRVEFDDDLLTRIYVSPQTGAIEARRNRIWRIYDFFWMLHIMDYSERENFNNPLVQAASVTGLLFALTGGWLVVLRLVRGKYAIRLRKQGSPEAAKGS